VRSIAWGRLRSWGSAHIGLEPERPLAYTVYSARTRGFSFPSTSQPDIPSVEETMLHMPRRRRFTIIEILIVLSVLTLLMALLIPTLTKSRSKAKKARWEGYMRNQRVSERMILQYLFLENDPTFSVVTNH